MPLRIEPVRDRKLHRLVKSAIRRAVRNGEAIFRLGDPGGQVFVVRRGHVRLQLAGTDGVDRTVAVAGPSELFGEEGMIHGALRPFNALAGAPGSVLPLEGATVRGVFSCAPRSTPSRPTLEAKEWELRLLRSAAGDSLGPSARQRLAAVLLDLFERLGEPEGERVRLPHWFTHRELADLAGAHRSTVTTCLNDWIWRGVVATRGRMLLAARSGLATLREEGLGHAVSIDPTLRQD